MSSIFVVWDDDLLEPLFYSPSYGDIVSFKEKYVGSWNVSVYENWWFKCKLDEA